MVQNRRESFDPLLTLLFAFLYAAAVYATAVFAEFLCSSFVQQFM